MQTRIQKTLALVLLFLPSTACSAEMETVAAKAGAPAAPGVSTKPAGPPGYSGHAELGERLEQIVRQAPEAAKLDVIAHSREGREVWVLQLARPGEQPPEARTAILVVAGLDATHLVGTETAVGLAEALLAPPEPAEAAPADEGEGASDVDDGGGDDENAPAETQPAEAKDPLEDHTIYILPRINPDGAERFMVTLRRECDGNTRPTDDDRDGVADDDPPDDLNGDGLITQMRVRDPEKATHFADADEPRLLRKAERAEDEHPIFALYTEGIDNDGDGRYNEDAVGGTVPNRNFPHAYAELGRDAGRHQLSEPETLALAEFVLAHPNIAAVIVYGRHDNLVNVPGDKKRDVSGRGYRDLHPGDSPLYRHISERFKKLTGLEAAPKSDNAGAFYGWAYNQRGLPTFATTLWWLPKAEKEEAKKDEATTQPATQPATAPVTTRPDAQPEDGGKKPAKKEGKKHGKKGDKKEVKKPPKKPGKKKGPLETERKWLKYSDEKRDGAGFVEWAPYDHPTLGKVEIGGFVPGFQINPPADEIPDIVKKQRAFVEDIAGRLPRPRVAEYKVTPRSDSVYEIEFFMTNDAYFPTALAMAKAARVSYPFVLRLALPAERVLGGRSIQRIDSIEGKRGIGKVRWLLAGEPDEAVKLTIYHKRFGTIETTIRLAETADSAEKTNKGDD